MPRPIDWTPEQLDRLETLRHAGASIRAAAAALGISRSSAGRQQQRLAARGGRLAHGIDPLPAGHAATWSAISNASWPCAA